MTTDKITKRQHIIGLFVALCIITGIFSLFFGGVFIIDQISSEPEDYTERPPGTQDYRDARLDEILEELQAIRALLEDIKAILEQQEGS